MTETPMDRETAEEIKRHFNVVAESLRSEIRTVVEGLVGFQDRVTEEFKGVREEFNEVKSMIRLSFGELDRRIRALEDDVSSCPRTQGGPMIRSLPIIARLLLLALLFSAAPSARAQTARPEMKQPPTAVVSLYRIAPGKHLDFLKWMAEAAAISKEAGVPADQWYSHTNGDSWDYLHVAPDLSKEQQAKVDEAAKKHGRKTGFAASLEIRTFVSWHTDTFVIGPVSAADLVSAAGK